MIRFFILSLLSLSLLSACNTIQGLGRDIEHLGNGINRTAANASS